MLSLAVVPFNIARAAVDVAMGPVPLPALGSSTREPLSGQLGEDTRAPTRAPPGVSGLRSEASNLVRIGRLMNRHPNQYLGSTCPCRPGDGHRATFPQAAFFRLTGQ